MSTNQKRAATSDEANAIAIQNAVKFGRPVYFLNHVNGSTIDVGTDKAAFLKEKQEYIRSTPDGRHKIKLFERVHHQLRAI